MWYSCQADKRPVRLQLSMRSMARHRRGRSCLPICFAGEHRLPDKPLDARRGTSRPGRLLLPVTILFICHVFLLAAGVDAQPQESQFQDEPPWWDRQWDHRIPILVAPNAGPYQDVQVRIDLREDIDPTFDWEPNGKDLRFVYFDTLTSENELLHHWLVTDRITHGAWFACCQFNGYM